jgi:nitroreductase
MEAREALLSRRSVRKYAAEAVPEAEVSRLLEAAMADISGGELPR